MKFNQIINNFSSGEWSPKMRARTDVQQYQNACETMLNFIPQIQGGAFRAPGTKLIPLITGNHQTRLQSILSATNGTPMIPRVLSNGKKEVLVAIPGVAPSTGWVVLQRTLGSHASAALNAVSTDADFVSSVSAKVGYTQVGDLVYLTDPSGVYAPRIWSYTSSGGNLDTLLYYALNVQSPITNAAWKCTPYLPINALGSPYNITMTAGAATGTTTLTASAAFFNSGHVGARFKLSSAGSTGVGRVTGYTSSTVVTYVVESTVPTVACGVAAGTSWEESAWSTYRGFPKFVTSFEGRVIFGGHALYPDTIWGSRIGNVFDFMERPFEQDSSFASYTTDNSRPFSLSPNMEGSGAINGLSAGKTLAILTNTSEILASGSQGALGPLDVSFESSTSFGAETVRPARVNNYLTYVQKGGRKVRDLVFNFNEDQYKSSDLSFIADHFTSSNTAGTGNVILDMVPTTIATSKGLLCRTSDGDLIFVVLDREYQIVAWSELAIAGTIGATSGAAIHGVCSLPDDNATDIAYVIVSRDINGTETVYIEQFLDLAEDDVLNQQNNLCMSGQTTQTLSPADTAFTGGSNLAGNTVQVVADGQFIGEKTVDASGNFTLTTAATTVTIGLKAVAKLKPLPPELGQQIPGTSQGLTKRVFEVSVRFWNSYAAKYGSTFSDLYPIDFKDPSVAQNNTPIMFTGPKKLSLDSGYGVDKTVCIQCDTPWPCNVLAVIQKGITND